MNPIESNILESGTLNSGGLAALLPKRQAVCNQLNGDAKGCGKESDSPIVVRDGRTDHVAKGWAERYRKQRTHGGRRMLPIPVSSYLLALGFRFDTLCLNRCPCARLSEEPCAGNPHAGICEGGAR